MVTDKYQFPKITADMYADLKHWYETHNEGKCAHRYHGAIGGAITFEITPTSIGDFVSAKCSCGEVLDWREEL